MGLRFTAHPQFVELQFEGALDASRLLGEMSQDQNDAIVDCARVLFDFSGASAWNVEPQAAGRHLTNLGRDGVRIAMYAIENPLAFGIARQMALFSGGESRFVRVFDSREKATFWLMYGNAVE